MDPFTLAVWAALVVFVLMLARGRSFWNALGAGAIVMVAGFVLECALLVLSGVAAGLTLAAVLLSLIAGPILLLLSPVLLVIGLIWLAGYARRNPV